MRASRHVIWMFPIALILGAGCASAQSFPNKPVRIVTGERGGGSDFASRLIAHGLTGLVGQPVIVDSRGGSIVIPAEIVAKAPPDGYTLLQYGGTIWLGPLLEKMPYDPVKDFAPITISASSPAVVIVHPSVAASIKELIAFAKAKPGSLNYASGPTGSSNHLSAELFKSMAGVDILRIAYKGTAPALADLIGGQVQLMFANALAAAPHVKSGRVRALAVTSARPSALFPGLPTVAASGLPGYEAGSIYGIFAPARTPAALIDRLNQWIVQVLNQADIKEKFLSAGAEVIGSSPQELAAAVKSEMARMGKVIKDAGLRVE